MSLSLCTSFMHYGYSLPIHLAVTKKRSAVSFEFRRDSTNANSTLPGPLYFIKSYYVCCIAQFHRGILLHVLHAPQQVPVLYRYTTFGCSCDSCISSKSLLRLFKSIYKASELPYKIPCILPTSIVKSV